MVAMRSWAVVRRRSVWSAARCAARRYPAGWQAHCALPVGVCDVGVERHLFPSERLRQYHSFGVADKRLLLWYKRQLLLSA